MSMAHMPWFSYAACDARGDVFLSGITNELTVAIDHCSDPPAVAAKIQQVQRAIDNELDYAYVPLGLPALGLRGIDGVMAWSLPASSALSLTS